ncbi:hypothetical protein ACWEVD_24825 [Nocardia thailandica]
MSSEDSKQLSVAELLARNGRQGGDSGASSGGRRRRSGRGIPVDALTGDLPSVPRNGGSSHSAPSQEPEPAPEPPAYSPPPAAAQPAPYPPPGPAEPAYSPMSGPITRFDPHSGFSAPDPRDPLGLSAQRAADPATADPFGPYRAEARPSADPFGPYRAEARGAEPAAPQAFQPEAPDTGSRSGRRRAGRLGGPEGDQPVDPQIAQMFGSGALPAVGGGGRRRKPDPEEEAEAPAAPPAGGRAARRRAAEAREESEAAAAATWQMGAPVGDYTEVIDRALGFEPSAPPSFAPDPAPAYPPQPQAPAFPPPAPTQAFAPAFPPPAQDFAQPTQAFAPAPPRPDADRPPLERRNAPGTGGLPAWSARNRTKPAPAEAPPPGPANAPEPWPQAKTPPQAPPDPDNADARTEVYRPVSGGHRPVHQNDPGPDTDGYAGEDYLDDTDYPDSDFDDRWDSDEYEAADYDSDEYEPAPAPSRLSKLKAKAGTKATATRAAATLARTRAGAAGKLPGRGAGSRVARLTGDDANRRQWLILGGQSLAAAVTGMLLFKGFETMWETLPWVALMLAMLVILGLVALVRVLRRTDDIFSTVIAVVVGVFVTLGPLAFLLSTG